MANTSSLLALANGVRAFFAVVNPAVVVTMTGWKQRFQQLNQGKPGANRVAFIPGEPNGADGEIVRGRQTSSNPRTLFDQERIVYVSVWAVDTTDTANDELQIAAVDNLLEQTLQGLQRAVDPATKTLVGQANLRPPFQMRWTVDNQDMTFGREVLIRVPLLSTFLDIPNNVVFPQGQLNTSTVV